MKYYDQTDISQETGDCFRACLQTILQNDLIEMPTFHRRDDWLCDYNQYLARSKLKYQIAAVPIDPECKLVLPVSCIFIVTVESQIYPGQTHAVVCRVWEDGEIHLEHDPNPVCRMNDDDFQNATKHWCFFAMRTI